MNAHAVEASDSESDESANSSTRPYEKVNIWWARSDLNRDAFAAGSEPTVSANFTTRPFMKPSLVGPLGLEPRCFRSGI